MREEVDGGEGTVVRVPQRGMSKVSFVGGSGVALLGSRDLLEVAAEDLNP